MQAETARRIGFALLVGAAFAASPLSSGRRLLPSILGGLAVAGAVWALRRPREPLAFRLAPPTRRSRLLLGATGAAAAGAFGPTLVDLFREFTWSVWQNAHGLMFPFLIWEAAYPRLRRMRGDGASSAWGFAPALLGMLLAVLGAAVGSLQLATLGLVLFGWGFSLLSLGPRCTRALAVPLGLCVFLVPLPTSLATPLGLPQLSASGAAWLLHTSGFPVLEQDRYLFVSAEFAYAISDNCSGFSTFIGGLALASFFAAHTRSRVRAMLLLAAPWPLAIAANSIRSAALIATCQSFGLSIANTPLDGISGIGAFWLVMAALLLMADHNGLREGLQ